jgi:hypothetical protein
MIWLDVPEPVVIGGRLIPAGGSWVPARLAVALIGLGLAVPGRRRPETATPKPGERAISIDKKGAIP